MFNEVATIDNHFNWVKAMAREVNIETQIDLAREISNILRGYLKKYHWEAISHSNVYTSETEIPLKIVIIPSPKGEGHITLLNPEIIKISSRKVPSFEGCGSIPGYKFIVERSPYCIVKGFTLSREEIKLEYGIEIIKKPFDIFDEYLFYSFCVQHEIDHLEGRILIDLPHVKTEYIPLFDKIEDLAQKLLREYHNKKILNF